jgi:hypothetical protein
MPAPSLILALIRSVLPKLRTHLIPLFGRVVEFMPEAVQHPE